MGIFDLLGASSKKVYSRDFKKGLKKISALSPKERTYVEKAFGSELKDGLSKFELERRCRQLKHKTGDPVQPHEVEKIRQKFLKNY